MRPTCDFCKNPLLLKQEVFVKREWVFDKKHTYFSLSQQDETTGITCSKCGEPIGQLKLASVGMYHHSNQIKRGSGTNFYKAYAAMAPLYHKFSYAEDKGGLILKKILKSTKSRGVLLDIGCGTGKYVGLLSGFFQKIYALDVSRELLTFNKKNNKRRGNIEYLLSSAEKIPLLDNTVDIIISTWGSFSPNEALLEMKRVLKNGGIIIRIGTIARDDLTELYSDFDEVYIKENSNYFELHGFTTEYSQISISFNTLEGAKNVLSGITGRKEGAITKKSLTHKIVIQTYKKQLGKNQLF